MKKAGASYADKNQVKKLVQQGITDPDHIAQKVNLQTDHVKAILRQISEGKLRLSPPTGDFKLSAKEKAQAKAHKVADTAERKAQAAAEKAQEAKQAKEEAKEAAEAAEQAESEIADLEQMETEAAEAGAETD